MITAGLDLGAKTIKVLILSQNSGGDGKHKFLARVLHLAGFEPREACEAAFSQALQEAGLTRESLDWVTATGAGRKEVPFAADEVTEVTADARGAVFLFPAARTVIDVGAEEGRGIRCNPLGAVIDFAVNEKCAAGAGSFTEAMARALEVKLEELGPLSLRSQNAIPMNAQCAVFAESEVVSLLHARTPKEDIARAVHDAIASRITSMVRKVGFEPEVVLVGGVARNPGFVDSMRRSLESNLLIPELPEFVGALGAALVAGERSRGGKAAGVTG